jgi:serine/threonine-protein kinase
MKKMTIEESHEKSAERWSRAIAAQFGASVPKSVTWEQTEQIIEILRKFVEKTDNHALFPEGGGMDLLTVRSSHETGCIELPVENRVSYVVRVKRLIFEHIERSPKDSFFLLELDILAPSGIYEEQDLAYEELVELEPTEYVDRGVWDQGYIGHDERGKEIALPTKARLVIRLLKGKVMLVSKESLWNSIPETYDGRHSGMTADQIGRAIEHLISEVEGR